MMRNYKLLLVLGFMLSYGILPFKLSGNVALTGSIGSDFKYGEEHTEFSDSSHTLICEEGKEVWEVLFDGKSTDKWMSSDGGIFPSDGWIIENGSLVLGEKGAGDIITRKRYSDFELRLDFNLTHEANSGVKYFVGELKNVKTGDVMFNGPEYQIIDDYNHPAVKNHQHDIAATASCYLIYAPKNVNLHSTGQWNHMRIVAKGKHVEHWLNGVKVVSYERGSVDFLKRKSVTKFKDFANYGELASGHILLTDHGDKVYFRNIKIRRL